MRPIYGPSELVDAARKALISRVVELTDDRSALQLELTSLQETISRLDNRVKEKEEEIKRYNVIHIWFQWFEFEFTLKIGFSQTSKETGRCSVDKP